MPWRMLVPQAGLVSEAKEYEKYGVRADLGRYELPFTTVDREAEMTAAHEEFTRRLGTRSEN